MPITDRFAHVVEAGWRRLRPFWRRSVRDQIDDEVAFHMVMRVAEFMGGHVAERRGGQSARTGHRHSPPF